jgi:hypothetical protein
VTPTAPRSLYLGSQTQTPVTTSVLRAVDYNRVSTEEQKRGYGITSGLRKTGAYISRKGWQHAGTYKDEGLSGSLGMGERGDFDRLMFDAEIRDTFGRRPFDVVVVPKGDRIGRTGRAFWRWVWALEVLNSAALRTTQRLSGRRSAVGPKMVSRKRRGKVAGRAGRHHSVSRLKIRASAESHG